MKQFLIEKIRAPDGTWTPFIEGEKAEFVDEQKL